jgi:hypothetical protein
MSQDSSADEEDEDGDKLEKLTDYRKNFSGGEESSSDSVNDSPQVKDDLPKDDLRKYHAFLELLSTEVGYFLDLKILVTVRSG